MSIPSTTIFCTVVLEFVVDNFEDLAMAVVKKTNYGAVSRVVLSVVAAAGIVSVALVAPGALQLLASGYRASRRNQRRKAFPADIRVAVKSLAKRGLVKVYQSRGETVVCLTEAGHTELLKYSLQEKMLVQKKWDGKWRMIIFDIEERRRKARDRVRRDLQSFGLVKLQESVWVYPYDCEEVVTLLKAEYRVSKDVLYVVAGEIEGDTWLRKQFQLP